MWLTLAVLPVIAHEASAGYANRERLPTDAAAPMDAVRAQSS